MSQSLYMAGIMIGSFVSGLLSGHSNHTKFCCVVVNRDIPLICDLEFEFYPDRFGRRRITLLAVSTKY